MLFCLVYFPYDVGRNYFLSLYTMYVFKMKTRNVGMTSCYRVKIHTIKLIKIFLDANEKNRSKEYSVAVSVVKRKL